MKRRVVVTGAGAVTPVGIGRESFWSALLRGESGIGEITRFDASDFPVRIVGEVDGFDPAQFLSNKEIRRTDRFTQFAVVAAMEAIEDSGLKLDEEDGSRIGVLIGSGIGGVETWEAEHRKLLEAGPARISPVFIPMMIIDMAAGQVSMRLGAKGPNYATVSACASGAHAIGEAYRSVERGDSDVMIAGGTEAPVTPLSVAGFSSMRALSTRNDEPEKASRPFERDRDGFVIGEGAGVVILEELERARSRGAPIYAEMVGYGLTSDAYHMTAPDPKGEGAARSMEMALKGGNLEPADVDYINAHGTSTPLNDKLETQAIKSVFGGHAKRMPISSTKSMTGHLLGAACAVEFVATCLAIRDSVVHSTINYEHPDPECDLDYVPNEARETQVKVALCNSFGFGGHNVTLALRRLEDY